MPEVERRRKQARRSSDLARPSALSAERAKQRLEHLYAISKQLTEFEGPEESVPRLLATAAEVVGLQSVVLIVDTEGSTSTTLWHAAGLSPLRLRRAEAHAKVAYERLADPVGAPRLRASTALTRVVPTFQAAEEGEHNAVVLPVAIARRPLFGALQVEGVGPLDEEDLGFVDAIVNQLAIALDRHYAWRSDRVQRRQAEAKERRANARADDESNARSAAETASRTKDEFLAILSHELRTPLNAIVGWSQMLRHGKLDEAGQARAIEVIHRNAITQSQLIADILDVQTIVSGKLRLELSPIDLVSVVELARDTLGPAAAAKGIQVELALHPAARRVWGDPQRLRQVVWNLLSNAIKFTPPGGYVKVRSRRTPQHVEICVSDDGPGIPPEFLPHVFERFRQADASSTRRHGGLGLGLAIVKSIVEQHGGTVAAANRAAGGAVFTVLLPDAAGAAEAAFTDERVAAADSTPALSGLRVLIVDDAPDDREVLETALTQMGADVATAASASEGLALVERTRPDVLISDIGMPQEDGFVFLRRVRELPTERGGLTPAVALTAYATAPDRLHALEAGFQMHVAKPVNPAELGAVVARLAGRRRSRGV